ncbi:MAG: tyrosine-type recombinase/integrase [Bacteroidales bacterium]|nr:tyrosine-type recombinase/integrase [Bacteroidales bacterium]
MATLKFYLSRYIKKDDERGEIQLRFSGKRDFVKRAPTGIFITAGNWDSEKGMPKGKKNKFGDNCEEIRDRLNQLTSYLIRCWEETEPKDLKPDSLTQWMKDIEWRSSSTPIYINGQEVISNQWTIFSKKRLQEEKVARKVERSKMENQYFLDVFAYFIEEQYKNGVIGDCRHKAYYTAHGLWDRMERYQGKQYRLKEVTTSLMYDYRHFIINEFELWETRTVMDKDGNSKEAYVPKRKYERIYDGYEYVKKRGVEKRSLNYVVVEIKYLIAFWHWLLKVKKLNIDDVFMNFNMDQSVYGTPFFFSNEDRQRLFEADLSKRPELAIQRDIFVFQSLVGCRVGDLKRLKRSNIIDGEMLQYVAGKTKNKSGKIVTVPLHPTAKIILERYSNNCEDSILPFISDQKYNDAIKEIFKLVPEIDRIVTILDPVTRLEKQVKLSEVASSHMGRRNFCGNLYEAGFRDSDIASMSGHAEGSKAISRYRKVSDETKKKMINAL